MRTLLLLILGIWAGMIIGISFMEAPLKFRAPNMTMPIALGVGQLVFGALNKVEIFFSLLSVVLVFVLRSDMNKMSILLTAGLALIVMMQSVWLLPALDERATQVINGITPTTSSKHLYYVICEVIKVILLITSFIKIYPHD